MKKYIQFIESKSKYVEVNYKIIVWDLKDNPITLITDFKIVKHEDKKIIKNRDKIYVEALNELLYTFQKELSNEDFYKFFELLIDEDLYDDYIDV